MKNSNNNNKIGNKIKIQWYYNIKVDNVLNGYCSKEGVIIIDFLRLTVNRYNIGILEQLVQL